MRGVVREKIQRQESLESAEKEKAHNKAEQKKTTKEKRSLSKDSPRKRHRTLSSGKQEAEPGNPARNKKSPTPPRRLKSLDTDLETSKLVKSPLKQSLENEMRYSAINEIIGGPDNYASDMQKRKIK